MRGLVTFTALSFAPVLAFAAMSDQLPALHQLFLIDAATALACYFIARYKSWLAVLAAILSAAIFTGMGNMWADKLLRHAALNERGIEYFALLIAGEILVLAAIVLGTVQGRRHPKRANPA